MKLLPKRLSEEELFQDVSLEWIGIIWMNIVFFLLG